MSEFVKSPSRSGVAGGNVTKGTKPNSTTMSIGTTPISARRSTSAGLGLRSTCPQSTPAHVSYSTPQPPRRNSNPTGSSSSGFYSHSPSESRRQSLELKCRRYSQPSSPSPFATSNADQLIRQEKASYSSLSFLPEVQTYLQFMEDTSAPSEHHFRSNSFHGRNSTDPEIRKRRTRSQSRSPAAGGGAEEEETCFQDSKPSTSTILTVHPNYGQYLTASRSESVDTAQVHPPPPVHTARRMSLGSSGGGGKSRATGFRLSPTTQTKSSTGTGIRHVPPPPPAVPPEPQQELTEDQGEESDSEQQDGPVFRRCFERRRSSTIRTSFI